MEASMELFNQWHSALANGSIHYPILGSVLVVAALGYLGAPLLLWTLVAAALLIGFGASTTVLLAFTVVAIVFNIPIIRQNTLSRAVMGLFKSLKLMPVISETERIALEAGQVWVEGDLFSGSPNFKKLMQEPYPNLTPDEQAFLNGPVEKLCQMVDDWKMYKERKMPTEAWDYLRREKFLGMIIPKEYGGLGFSALAHSEVIQKLSSRSVPLAVTVMVPNSLGPAELLIHYGTDEQKNHYLPRLARGEEIPCFALTEPAAGSDAGSITAEGILFKGPDGKLYMKLNWNKRWITLAAISTVIGLAFRLRDPENLLGRGPDVGITCALIPTSTPGVVVGKRHDPLGVPFYNCPTQGKDVVVSVDTIFGGLNGAGRGWKMLMESLAAGRGISLPAQSTGMIKMGLRVSSNHAAIRKQFGVPLAQFEGIEEPLARIAGFTYMCEALRRFTLGGLDKGIKPPVVTAIAKYNTTELARKAIGDAMDIMGGAGISRGPRNLLAAAYNAAPIGITVEGANILTRTLIIFGQGALRAHPYAFKEVNALEKGDLKAFDRAFWGHMGHIVHNLFRAICLSLTRGTIAQAPAPIVGRIAKYYRKLSWASASFAILADIAMGSLGGKLKMKEKLTGRFADILSYMMIGTAVLRRFKADGSKKEDLPLVHFTMNYCFYQIQKAFDGILGNLSVPGLTWLFRGPIRWWSSLNSMGGEDSDDHTHKIAHLITQDSAQRNRVTEGIYFPADPHEQLHRLEVTFKTVKRAEAVDKKVRKAVKSGQIPKAKGAALIVSAFEKGIITKEERDDLMNSETMRWSAIQVDDFSEEEYVNNKVYTDTKQALEALRGA